MRRRTCNRLIPILLLATGLPAAAAPGPVTNLRRVASAVETAGAGPAELRRQAFRRRVEREAIEIARGRVAAPDRFETTASRFGGTDVVAEGVLRLEPGDVSGPNSSGIVQVSFRVLVDDVPRGVARASVRGTVRGPAVVARRTLKRGEAVGSGDVEIVDAELTRLTDRPLRALSDLRGLVPTRTLGIDRVITAGLVEPEAVVRRGQAVEMRIERSSLTVTARGTVLSDGAPGELVAARNTSTGARVVGRVQSDGTLIVTQGATAGGIR